MGERFHPRRKKTPSFSSSLLDAIFLSIDEPHDIKKGKSQCGGDCEGCLHGRKQDTVKVEEDSANDKWMQNYIKGTRSLRHFNSDSSSSAESSLFSSIETEPPAAASRSGSKHEGRLFMTTKSKALKIYKDLKKVRQPISPGGKFTNFLNSFLFNTKNLSISGVKPRPVKDSNIKSQTLRPCLDKRAPSSANKSKRSVTFCPAVSVIVDEGHKNIYDDLDYGSSLRQSSRTSSQYVKKSIRDRGVKHSYEYGNHFRGSSHEEDSSNDDDDDDGESCTSSDLFELDNIGIAGMCSSNEDLPVYGTTKLTRNQAIATMTVV